MLLNYFNFIIFSRLDTIIYVLTINKIFDNNSVLYNSAYVWRSHPYDGESMNHVDDRFFICSNECTPILKDLLLLLKNKDIHTMLKNGISPEEIIGNIFNKYVFMILHHCNSNFSYKHLVYCNKKCQLRLILI